MDIQTNSVASETQDPAPEVETIISADTSSGDTPENQPPATDSGEQGWLRRFGAKIKAWAASLKRDVCALWLAYKRPETPWYAKALAAVTVAYALSPVDLIPDFIPVLGYLDDLILVPALVAICLRLIPRDVMADCRAQAVDLWKDGKPKRWFYAVPIVLVWLVVIALVVRAVRG